MTIRKLSCILVMCFFFSFCIRYESIFAENQANYLRASKVKLHNIKYRAKQIKHSGEYTIYVKNKGKKSVKFYIRKKENKENHIEGVIKPGRVQFIHNVWVEKGEKIIMIAKTGARFVNGHIQASLTLYEEEQ